MAAYNCSPEINYKTTLLAIAKKQRELLKKSFDWERCELIEEEPVRRSLFRRTKLTEKEQLRNDLIALQREADELRGRIGVPEGVYWWNLPWDMVEKFLINDLTEVKRDGGWRFESSMKAVPIADNIMYLMMREEGHCSSFSCQTIYERESVSPYSQGEREDLMRKYDEKVLNYNLAQYAWLQSKDALVQSSLTGDVYRDAAEYYLAEGMYLDSTRRSSFERSLSQEHITRGLAVEKTNSIHITAVFSLGKYKTDGHGKLVAAESCGYEMEAISEPDFADVMIERHKKQDALIKCGAYFADCEDITHIPFELLCKDEKAEDGQYKVVLEQAEICTCLAEKIVLTC